MGRDVSHCVWKHSRARLGARLIQLAIADHAEGERWTSFAGTKTLAEEALVSETAAKDAIKRLREDGELVIVAKGGEGRGYKTVYRVLCAIGKCVPSLYEKGRETDPFAELQRGKRLAASEHPGSGRNPAPSRSGKGQVADPGRGKLRQARIRNEPKAEPKAIPPSAVARARDGETPAQGSLDGLTPEPPPLVRGDPPVKALVPFRPEDQSEQQTPARNGAQPDAQVLLGEHIDVIGERPPGREVGRLAAQLKTLLAEGINPGWIRMGLAILRYRGLDVGKLGSCVNQAMSQAAAVRNGDGRAVRDGQPRDARGRPVGWRQVAANGSVGITLDGGELDDWVENYRPPPPGVDPYLAFIRGGNAGSGDGGPS